MYFKHTFLFSAITILILNGCGGSSTSSPEDTSTNQAPVAQDLVLTTKTDNAIVEDQSVTIDLKASDKEEDTLIYQLLQKPNHGTIVQEEENRYTYTPASNYYGDDSFTYKVCDSQGLCSNEAKVTLEIIAVNDAPVAEGKDVSLDEDTTRDIAMSGSDVDGDDLTFEVKTAPEHGTYEDGTYTPDENFNGADSFTYVANDGKVDSKEVTVAITVKAVNDAPVAQADREKINESESIIIDVLSNDSDVDGDRLSITDLSAPEHGTAEVQDGKVRYTPEENYSGEDSFTYSASDGTLNSEKVNVEIEINGMPVAYNMTVSMWNLEEKYAVNANDKDGDILSYQATSDPLLGTLDKNGTYIPNDNARGVDTFSYKACDEESCSEEANITVKIKAPLIEIYDTSIEANTSSTQLKIAKYLYDFENNFNIIIDWGDGSRDYNVTDTIIHNYESEGNYTVKIAGTYQSWFGNSTLSSPSENYDAPKLKSIKQWGDIEWKTMEYAFYNCYNMQGEAVDTPDLSLTTNLTGMFAEAKSFNQDIGNWNVAGVTTMTKMFAEAKSFNQDISKWDVSSVSDMSYMFLDADDFNQDIGEWKVDEVIRMHSMFSGAKSFNQNIGRWNVSHVVDMHEMFSRADAFNQDIGEWDVSSVEDMSFMFYSVDAFNQDIEVWNTESTISMSGMFYGAESFNQDIRAWNVSSVEDMSFMFYRAGTFNQNIGAWNVGSVTDMSSMFYGADEFNQDIGGWDVHNVATMSSMFALADSFDQNIGEWDVSSVTDMSSMFEDADAFNQDIRAWNVGSVTDMSSMFYGADEFNQDIGGWDVHNVATMSSMFALADSFDQNIGEWDVSSVTDMSYMFAKITLSTENYDALLNGWDKLELQSDVSFHAGDSKYSEDAEDARKSIIDTYNWNISDGGAL